MSMLESALACAQRGWFIFPIEPKGKQPIARLAPHGFKNSTNDPEVIQSWWSQVPTANIGIDLGRSNLTVLDFDSGDAPANLGLPETFAVRTSRGQHVYFKGVSKSSNMYFDGKHVGEVKSSGGYVVGPQSEHTSGAIYSPNDHPAADLPVDLLAKLVKAESNPVTIQGDKIPYGQHYTELLRIAGFLRSQVGLEKEGIKTALIEICEKRCENYGGDYQEMCEHLADEMAKKPINAATVYVGSSQQQPGPQQPAAPRTDENFEDYFRSFDQLEDGGVRMLINGFLPEGVNFIGGLAGQGKTFFALSLVKSLTSGEPFLGKFQPTEIIPVIYMAPESSSRAFKERCRKFGITRDPELFLCRTITEGPALRLDSPVLAQAVAKMKPLIVLDTLTRFNESENEDDAAANKKLADDIVKLRSLGCVGVLVLHHASKASADAPMTLENILRGTGDFGALADSVYGIRRDRVLYADGAGPLELSVVGLKPRDFDGPAAFRIAASYRSEDGTIKSYLDESGDFCVVEPAEVLAVQEKVFIQTIIAQPEISRDALADKLALSSRQFRKLATELGYVRSEGPHGKWRVADLKSFAPPSTSSNVVEFRSPRNKKEEPTQLNLTQQ